MKCKLCGKQLIKQQKKFCSLLCSSKWFHKNIGQKGDKNPNYKHGAYINKKHKNIYYQRLKHEPLKLKARYILRNAVRRLGLQKPKNCSKCGKECITEGHHEDYTKPLDVIWLCHKCHLKINNVAGSNPANLV